MPSYRPGWLHVERHGHEDGLPILVEILVQGRLQHNHINYVKKIVQSMNYFYIFFLSN